MGPMRTVGRLFGVCAMFVMWVPVAVGLVHSPKVTVLERARAGVVAVGSRDEVQ